jgi:AraC-like DNA-binding protein
MINRKTNNRGGARVFLRRDVRSLFNHFSSLFGIRIAFFLPDGTTLGRGVQKGSSGFCRFIDKGLKLRPRCLRDDRASRAECARKKRMVSYRCHAGLTEAVAPVHAFDELLGYVMIGQFRSTRTLKKSLLRGVRKPRDRRRLRREFEALAYLPPKKTENLLYLFRRLVEFIVARHLIEIKKGQVIKKVMDYVEERLHGPVTLSEVARHCCRSNTAITHLFRKESGISFKSYLLKRKIEKADEYLRGRPELSMAEISDKLGFNDQFHFSKTYRNLKGRPPSAVRKG